MEHTIILTETEQMAMEYIAADVNEWISINASHRARVAIDEICQLYTSYKIKNKEPITAVGEDEIVASAYAEGIIKTAAQKQQESIDPAPSS